ncbi:MAG: hypothetical protein ACRD5G_07295 [Candidatus Acidiferrales bacterium]
MIIEIDPSTGNVLREFAQPGDWEWDSSCPHAHWEEYRGRRFFVYFHNDQLVLQPDQDRYVLDSSYSSEIKGFLGFWLRFVLRKRDDVMLRFLYRDPSSRFRSLLFDDWWNWDTPFDFVNEHLARPGARRPTSC